MQGAFSKLFKIQNSFKIHIKRMLPRLFQWPSSAAAVESDACEFTIGAWRPCKVEGFSKYSSTSKFTLKGSDWEH